MYCRYLYYTKFSGFLKFWAVTFVISTTLVALLKHEKDTDDIRTSEEADNELDRGVMDTYK